MTARSDDELAETAAASSTPADPLGRTVTTGSGDVPRRPAGDSLGRLRLERVLGRGGMGTVHAAYDPDLDRRVAVKLLHAADPDARARLLREARAMAKLSHANVITVFDVGSADGQDFVTMELVDGETVKDWLARAKPSWREIVAAFIQAGRGLAAAHDAGLVHRDFKPANVLRSTAGEIVVTDFGLSRTASETTAEPPVAGRPTTDTGPTTRTATGAFLGTPAYMAPEQWTGQPVGPASDQFAFAVALAEALAGKRPYSGESLDELKDSVMRGPVVDDAIPPAVKPIVRRALATKPEERWPSMTAMLDALDRALGRRRRRIRLAAALAIGAAGTVGILALGSHHAPGIDCSPPALDPATVWSAARAATVENRDPESAKLIAADVESWRAERGRACVAPPATRSSQLACLDGVLARLDLAASGFERPGSAGIDGTATILVDPAVCAHIPTPHLTSPIDRELAAAFDDLRAVRDGGSGTNPPPATEPCARSLQLRTRAIVLGIKEFDVANMGALFQTVKEAGQAVEHCSDDVIRAAVLLGLAHGATDLARADAAIAAAPTDDFLAEADLARGELAANGSFDTTMADYKRALDRLSRRHHPRTQLRVIIAMQRLLSFRGHTADLTEVIALDAKWRAGALPADQQGLDQETAPARWRLGDVEGADTLADQVGPPREMMAGASTAPTKPVAGIVVDEAGHPVAGADVVLADDLDADSAVGASPFTLRHEQHTHSDDRGAFSVKEGRSLAVAWTKDQRSAFVETETAPVRLVVHPTVTVAGTVALGAADGSQMHVTMTSTDPKALYEEIAPVRSDGSFEMRHALRGSMTIVAREYGITDGDPPQPIVVSGDVRNVKLIAQVARPLHVLARNAGVTPLDVAVVFVYTGHLPPSHATLTALDRRQAATLQAFAGRQAVPDDVAKQMQPDDLFATLRGRPSGPLFVCAAGMTRDMFSMLRTEAAFLRSFANTDLGCTEVPADQPIVVVDVPPIRKPTTP